MWEKGCSDPPQAGRGGVWGQACVLISKRCTYRFQRAGKILLYLIGGQPDKADAERLDEFLALLVGHLLAAVYRTVYLNRQSLFRAVEVEDVGPNGKLAAEFSSVQLPAPECLP